MLIRISFKSALLVLLQVTFIAYLIFSGRVIYFDALYIFLVLLSVIPGLWGILLMKTKLRITPEPARGAKLISEGPYKYIRHPMYATVIALTFVWIIFDFSSFRLAVFLLLVFNLMIKMYYEENILKNSIDGYSEYMNNSKRIIPFIF